jgi:hypothetical protein
MNFVTACLAPCDGGAEQLTTTNDTNDTNLAAHVLSPAVTWWSKWSWSFWSKSIFVTTQIYAKNTSQKLNADLTMLGDKLNASFKSIK